ncbi:MAG: arginine--tRNA ligase [Desulfonatronovibrionaceae bacterium]
MRSEQIIEDLLKNFFQSKGLAWPKKAVVEPPKDKKFGDVASNAALVGSGEAGQNPRTLAEEIREFCLAQEERLEKAETAGPGFLNFTFDRDFWKEVIPDVLGSGEEYGSNHFGQGRPVQVEYVSANPTGPLHIGHGRGAAVGDSLARIMRFAGYEVSTEYYLNDAGRQMRLLGESVLIRLEQLAGREVDLPEECYKGDYIRAIAEEILSAKGPHILDRPREELLDICRQSALESILAGIKKDLFEFRVEHQVWFSEESLVSDGRVEDTLDWLREKDLAYEQNGALWFRTTEFGDDKDRVLRKSDGTLTYFATDIAYHKDKYDRGFDLVVDIWGADHHGYVPRMKAAVQALGQERENLQVILVQLVNLLRAGEQIAMSTRAGKFETLSDVCREVGTDAARFIFLTRKSDSHLDFDLELVKKQSMDNPVYYVQYAHARICSVMRKARERGIQIQRGTRELLPALDTAEDLDLLKCMEKFPDAVISSSRSLSPHHLCYYLQDLAGMLHRYYTVNPVLSAADEDVVQARMLILKAVATVLKNGLGLLGVSAPESM